MLFLSFLFVNINLINFIMWSFVWNIIWLIAFLPLTPPAPLASTSRLPLWRTSGVRNEICITMVWHFPVWCQLLSIYSVVPVITLVSHPPQASILHLLAMVHCKTLQCSDLKWKITMKSKVIMLEKKMFPGS